MGKKEQNIQRVNPDSDFLSLLKIPLHACTHKSHVYILNVDYVLIQESYLPSEII